MTHRRKFCLFIRHHKIKTGKSMKSGIFVLAIGVCFSHFTTPISDPDVDAEHKLEFLKERKSLRLNPADKQTLLRLHNEYRRTVSPPAADMRLMIWDAAAEESAQKWADNCVFEHGMPSGYEAMGQNLYHGDKDGVRALFMWWNETVVYDFRTNYCEPGEQCGHYTQMAWASSYLLGCAISRCPPPVRNYVVCHYRPPGNVVGHWPYQVGRPCSQCDAGNGGVCYKDLCVTKDQCEALKLDCNCPLKCHNCGVLNRQHCSCTCKDGWDSLDCSKKCKDEHELCWVSPGFPNGQSCTLDRRIPKHFCRAMCQQCAVRPPFFPMYFFDPNATGESGNKFNLCCNGQECPEGYVLDEDFCACKQLCPGPACGHSGQETRTIHLIVHVGTICLLYLFV